MDSICSSSPPNGLFYSAMLGSEAAGMGGLRRLPDSAVEIAQIYTRPRLRGRGLGGCLVRQLLEQPRCLSHEVVKPDPGRFMASAQKIYRAAVFVEIPPYPGAEPPEVLQPHWLDLQKSR